MRRKIAGILVAGLLIAGCQSTPGVTHDPYTGTTLYHSARMQAANSLFASVWVQAVYSPGAGYGLQTNYFNTGLGWAFLESAHAGGRSYPYLVTDRRVGSCGAGSCTIFEDGLIGLEKHEVEGLARTGFDFKLVGKRGSIVGKVPAEIFQQVLSQSSGATPATSVSVPSSPVARPRVVEPAPVARMEMAAPVYSPTTAESRSGVRFHR